MIHPLKTVLFNPGVYKSVLEINPIVSLASLGGALSPQDLHFRAQGSVLGGGTG